MALSPKPYALSTGHCAALPSDFESKTLNAGQYAAFGKVTQGMDLLDKILEVDTFKSVCAKTCACGTCGASL